MAIKLFLCVLFGVIAGVFSWLTMVCVGHALAIFASSIELWALLWVAALVCLVAAAFFALVSVVSIQEASKAT